MMNMDMIEKSLLFGVVRDKAWGTLLSNGMVLEYFSFANQAIYSYIKDNLDRGQYPDIYTMAFAFHIDDYVLQEYLAVENLEELCDVVRKSYASQLLNNKIAMLNENITEMDTDPYKFIERLTECTNSLKHISTSIKSVGLLDDIDDIVTIDENNTISSGFKELDAKLRGWKRGEDLIVFVGRTGQGKSWFGLKFAMSAALNGEKVGIYSGEMSKQQLQERILCCGKQTYTSTREDALQFIKDSKIDIRLLTQADLRRKANIDDIEEFIVRERLTMLVVDQLSLMEDNTCKPGTPLRQQYGNISMDLFTLSTRYEIPIILLVQSNRKGTEEKNAPALENIAESDAVAQNATRVISMRKEPTGILTLTILKNRYGDNRLEQKYDVDYGINKYKPIADISAQIESQRKINTNSMFRSTRTF